MISFFRKLAGTAVARLFFLALAVAFIGWGVSTRGVFDGPGGQDAATVGGTPIPAQMFQLTYKQDFQKLLERVGGDASKIPPDIRRQLAEGVLRRMVAQAALDDQAARLGLTAPDTSVAKAISGMPAFAGIDGKFDRAAYQRVLGENNFTPHRFQEAVRSDMVRTQLVNALVAGAAPSDTLTEIIFSLVGETRQADMVMLPFAAAPAGPAPTEAALRRFYTNNVARYRAPEYRRIRLAVLSPASIGRDTAVPDSEIDAYYKARRDEYVKPELRSLQVVTASAAADAQAILALWRGGADWTAVQKAAAARKASAAALDDTTKAGVPSPELAAAAFAARSGEIGGPVAEPLGFQVFRITRIVPGRVVPLADARDGIRRKIAEEKALEVIDARAQKLQDLLAGGSRLDEIPADLGATGAEGTLDAQGRTPDGAPAPLPVPEKQRAEVIARAFQTAKGEAPGLNEGTDHVWYALAVDAITPPATKPYEKVAPQVLADWKADRARRTQEEAAAKMLALVKGGQTLANAAWGSGHQVTRTPPVPRNGGAEGVPPQLAQALFGLKKGETTMLETPTAFVVATLADITRPTAKEHPRDVARVREDLTQALQDETTAAYAQAVTNGVRTQINAKVVDAVVGEGAP